MKQITIYMDKQKAKQLAASAEADGRSLNSLINKILKDWIDGK